MTYDSLLLNYGGGIISSSKQSRQYAGAAAVAIGIGGTGVAALAELKRKVYQQLIPDNPGEPVPRYDHIQFLAIDSDEDVIAKMKGKARLNASSEFFSISNPHLKAALGGKDVIRKNPIFNWMEIDKINELLSPQGAGGVRQVGRYLLLSKAAALKTKIEEKCTTALRGLDSPSLDIYLFAGISGGTGSGCFLDTCYIVRKALEDKGWDASGNLMGFFFLPDVVTSKPDVASKPACVAYNHSNGYAAMKELDYLMDLKSGNDFFRQNYGAFSVDTQEPPVDLCHLISATKSDGSVLVNGFGYGIHVASDYVMAYLADVDLGGVTAGEEDGGLTMRGHLANVSKGVDTLSRAHGTNLSYHVLGAANAEIPMTQIATYLAAGFYRRFQARVGRERTVVTKSMVDEWVQKLGLSADQVYSDLTRGSDALFLPEIDRKDLVSYGVMPKGKAPQPWSTPGNAWLDACSGKRTQNHSALTAPLTTFDFEKVPDDSLTGKVFRRLYELSMDPDYGPYYAAGLLNHAGYDLMSALDGAIKQAEEERSTQRLQLDGNGSGGRDEYVSQCNTDFCHRPNKNNYARYLDGVEQGFLLLNRYNEYDDLVSTLRALKNSLEKLYNTYFVPLLKLLDDLKDTFVEDDRYLNSSAAAATTAYTTRILELSDVRPRLDAAIEGLAVNELVNKFMGHILKGYDQWLTGDDGKIGQYISAYMERAFGAEVNRSLQDYLFDKYPNAGGDVNLLAQEIERDIIGQIHQSALPMFWCNPTFDLSDPTVTYQTSSISVPRNASAVCGAADSFKTSHIEYVVRKTGLNDRIFALRFFSGVPFYAYHGITLLKSDYDKAATTRAGVGSHLYAYTGRGEDGSGRKDWRSFLPVPAPYSAQPDLVPGAEQLLALYDAGEASGIITQNVTGSYVVLQTAPVSVPAYHLDDFLGADGTLQLGPLDGIRTDLTRQLEDLHRPGMGQVEILLKNDGDPDLGAAVVTRVRKDYFLHYPKLQEVVRAELDKRAALQAGIDTLNAIEADYRHYTEDLELFCDLLFYGILPCTDGTGHSVYTAGQNGTVEKRKIDRIIYSYTDSRGMEVEQVFSRNNEKGMDYSQDYPLYQAFLTYRSLLPDAQPRQEMDEAVRERRKALLHKGDNVIGYILEQTWDKPALGKLQKDLSSFPQQKQHELLRFYLGLVRCIGQFRDKFSYEEWTYLPSETSTAVRPSAAQSAPADAQLKVWTLWDGRRYLYVYENNQSFGLDQTTNQWVPITAEMLVWNQATGSWIPVAGPDGDIRLP